MQFDSTFTVVSKCGPTKFLEIKRNSPEWNRMWKELEKKVQNKFDLDDLSGWEYLCSNRINGHSFRHRFHSKTRMPEFFFVELGSDLKDSVEREFEIENIIVHGPSCTCRIRNLGKTF